MVTICTAGLTFSNSTFCPHSVFKCFVWIWEQTAVISLYSIIWLVCITEVSVPWSYNIKAVSWLRRSVAGFSPPTPEFDPRSVRVGSLVDRVAVGQDSVPVLRLSPVSVVAPMLHTHLDRHGCLTRGTNELSLGTFQKAVLFRKFGSVRYKNPLLFFWVFKEICHNLFGRPWSMVASSFRLR